MTLNHAPGQTKEFTSDCFFYISLANVFHSLCELFSCFKFILVMHGLETLPFIHSSTLLKTITASSRPQTPWSRGQHKQSLQRSYSELLLNRPARAKWWLFLKLLIYAHCKQKRRRTPDRHSRPHFMIQTLSCSHTLICFGSLLVLMCIVTEHDNPSLAQHAS